MNHPHPNVSSSARRMLQFISLTGIIVILLQLWATASPGYDNWGLHLFAFLPDGMKVLFLLLMLSVLIPSVQRFVLIRIERAINTWYKISPERRVLFSIIALAAGATLFWLAREGTTFLGDGFGDIRSLPSLKSHADIPSLFRHEPMAGYLDWQFYNFFNALGIHSSAQLAFTAVSILCGIAFIIILVYFTRLLTDNAIDRFWMYAFIMVSGGTELFFGYAETYPPAYLCYLIFLLTGVLYLRGRASLLLPSVVFACLIVFFFGMLAFTPVLLLLYFRSIRKRKFGITIVSFLVMIVTSGILLYICGYTPEALNERFSMTESHILPLFQHSDRQGYTVFSYPHLWELANLQFLLSPFALLLLFILLLTNIKTLQWNNLEWLFIFFNACCGLIMIAVFQCDIGMSRDWDLLAVFELGTIVAVLYLVKYSSFEIDTTRRLLMMVTFLTALHTLGFVLVNTDENYAIPRIKTLLENPLWGKKAFLVVEEVAIYYREQNRYQEAAECYRKFLQHDSTNSRYFGNLADMYRLIGNNDSERIFTERAINAGSKVPALYFNLGILYAKSSRFAEAIEVMKGGLQFDPRRPDILNSIGVFIMHGKQAYNEALPYFQDAMNIDTTYSLAYLNSGLCYYHLGNRQGTIYYLKKFLEMDPNYPGRSQLTDILEEVTK